MIKNNPSQETIKPYQTIDHDKIKRYPTEYQDQICSSIFRNADRKDMFIEKKLQLNILLIKKRLLVGGIFLKILKMIYIRILRSLLLLYCIALY